MVRAEDVEKMMGLAGELMELPADATVRTKHMLSGLCRLVGADFANFADTLTTEEGDQLKVLTGSMTPWDVGTLDGVVRYFQTGWPHDPICPEIYRRLAQQADPVLTCLREEVVDRRAWEGSDHYHQVRKPAKLDESISAKIRMPDGKRVVNVAVHRCTGERAFGARERLILDLFYRHIARRIYGRVWRETYGKFMGLAPRARETLTHLMGGKSGKQIARAMGISLFSVNDYLKEIYRHYGVSGRGELMAKWNGGGEANGEG
jgi:DNA-binding CsgD family transcriptional regulator